MYEILQKAHSGWAYLVLIALVIALLNSILGMNSKREFAAKDKRLALIGLIATHFQLVLGLLLYFISPVGLASLGQMSNSALRLTSLEHPLINVIAIALITIGWSKHKKANESQSKFKAIAVFYGIGLLLILSRIPWALWF
jgi:NADH:ubiquinone oxidoreductase subunit 2 (subunit N)